MKKTILISTGIFLMAPLSLAGGSSSAGAGLPRNISNEILNHPVIVAVEKLLNDKHGDKCQLPASEKDIHWMCTGALPPVTQPTIFSSGCGFFLSIECPGETAMISGSTVHYFLLTPGQPSSVKPTEDRVIIGNIEFK